MASNNLNLGFDPSKNTLGYDPNPIKITNTKKKNDENNFLDNFKNNLTRPLKKLTNTSRYVTTKAQQTINGKTGRETSTRKTTPNVFSPVSSYKVQQMTPNSPLNKTAETMYNSAKEVGKDVADAGVEFIKHPIKSTKTFSNSLGNAMTDGIEKTIEGTSDFLDNTIGKTSLGRNTKILLAPIQKKYSEYKEDLKERQLKELTKKYKDNHERLEFEIIKNGLNDEVSMRDYIKGKDETYQKYINGELSDSQETIYNIGQNIGNMLPSVALSTINPTVGTVAFGMQAYEGYYQDALNRGYSNSKAHSYGTIMGGAELIVERLGFDELGGLNKLSKGSVLKSMGGEALEEFVMPYIDSTVKTAYGEDVNWNNTIYESVESAVYGAVIGGLMNLGGKGLSKVDIVVNKINNKQTVSSDEMAAALSEVKNNNPEYFNKIIEGLDQKTVSEISKKINTKQKTAETKVPTVQEVVAQKNTKKAEDVESNDIMSNDINAQGDTSVAFYDNNIAQSNESVNSINNELVKYTEHEIDNYKNGRVKIANSLSDVDIFVKAAKKAPSNAKLYFGKIGSNIANKIKLKLGLEIENYNLSLPANAINHILKNHGDIKVETDRGQVAITDNDFKLIPQIVTEFDDVTDSGLTTEGKKVITFKKRIGDTYYLVNYVSNKNHNLEVKTMYKLKKKNSATASDELNPQSWTSETDSGTSSFYDNNIAQIDKNVKLPIVNTNNMQNTENNTNKVINPLEISKLTPKDANTTPVLPTQKVSTGRGESKFAKNIENKTNMLTKESKYEILDSNEVKYYQEVTNKESLEKAFEKLNKGGESETLNWLNKKSENATSVDVAEGWILLKQYQDKIAKTTDISTKDDLNRSMVEVAKKMREIGTKAGQTVQAYNILNRLTPEGMVYYAQSELSEAFDTMSKNKTKEWIDSNREKFNLTPQETEFIMKTMQEVQQMEDGYDKRVKLAEIQKVMTDKLPPERGAGIKAWMRISMLFNPKTQVRNVMGNAIIAPVNTFSDLFASGVDKLISKKTGVRTTGTTDVKSYLKGFKEGAYQSYNDFKKGINTRNIQGNRFEITEGKSFNDNTSIGKTLNRVDSLLSFMLDAGDRTFYEATFTNSINNQLKLNNTTEVTQDMIDIATAEALSRTWQDNSRYTQSVIAIRNILNGKVGRFKGLNYGLGDILIPFAKTPANLTKAIIDYSPAGLVTAIVDGVNLKRSLTNGQYTAQMQHKFVQDLGKATAGSMLYILGIALAKAGITTGESDDDKDVSNFMKNTLGISSYSIKIGNKSFTYDWAQPIAAPFAMTANSVQKQKEGANLCENIVSTLDTGLNVLFEQSFLESMSNVLSESGQIGTKLIEQLLDLPSRAVPTLFKQIADLIDPVQRQTFEKDKPLETTVNKVKAKIPGLSKTLAPSVDTMGREIKKYGGKNNIFNVFLNPANVNTENISKSAQEIYRLYKSTGETNIMPRVAPYSFNKNNKEILLTSKQRAQYQKLSGEIIEDNINKLLKALEYKNMTDIEKANVINNIVDYAYNITQKEVLGMELSKEYEKAEQYSRIGNISDYYTFKASIDDTNKDTKKTSITNYLINSNLNNKQLAFLYGSYYSSKETLNSLLDANIPIKEFIKFNSKEFTTDYYANGKAVTNSRKMKVIKYVNSLNLSVAQKAILIKMEYSSYDKYNSQIVSYINKMNYSKFEKASLLKSIGFDNYDKYLIQYVNKLNITKIEKQEMLEELGFTVRNGRVYS